MDISFVSACIALLILFGGCTANVTRPSAEPTPFTEDAPSPTDTGAATEPAEEFTPQPKVIPTMMLPPVETDIFEELGDYIYMSPVSGNEYGVMVIKNDGTIVTWGEEVPLLYPTDVPETIGKAVFVSKARWQSMAIDNEGTLWNWGARNWYDRDITYEILHKPIMRNVQMASAGSYFAIVLRKDGTLWSWGVNDGGLGLGYDMVREHGFGDDWMYPVIEPGMVLDNVIFAIPGYAIRDDYTLWGWGYIGINVNPDDPYVYEPTYIMGDVKYVSNHIAVKTDGTLWTFGKRVFYAPHSGEEPFPSYFSGGPPVQIAEGVRLAKLEYERFMVIMEDGSLWVWGDNTYGALGDGTDEFRYEPFKLMDNVIYVTAGADNIFVVTANGELWETGLHYGVRWELYAYGRTPTAEEFRTAWIPRKIMDDVLIPQS